MRLSALLIYLVNISAPGVYAAIVWDNGTYTNVTGANMTTFAEAEDLTFTSPTHVTSFGSGPSPGQRISASSTVRLAGHFMRITTDCLESL